MARFILGIVVLAVAIGSARAAAQQCITFSSAVPCVAKDGPIDRLQFGAAKEALCRSEFPVEHAGRHIDRPEGQADASRGHAAFV